MFIIGICDDEIHMLRELKERSASFFAERQIEAKTVQFSNGIDLLQYKKQLDIIFLDIQMDGLDGMETARRLRSRGYEGFLIFVTVLGELVFDAFAVEAFDYLVKPIRDNCFEKTMERLLNTHYRQLGGELLIKRGYESQIVPFDDIVYCEIINRKIYIHLSDHEVIDYYDKLEKLEQKLDGHFFRCHRSYVINLKFLKSYKEGQAYLTSGESVPVSRLRGKEFSQTILNYMKGLRG